MRLATWNVNSIRARVDRVVDYLERADIDVLLIQETKCKPEQLPLAPFAAAGYEVVTHGLSQWNGVAIASRIGDADARRDGYAIPLAKPVSDHFVAGRSERRERQLLGLALGLLDQQHVDVGPFQIVDHPVDAGPDRVHIPRGEAHGTTLPGRPA